MVTNVFLRPNMYLEILEFVVTSLTMNKCLLCTKWADEWVKAQKLNKIKILQMNKNETL